MQKPLISILIPFKNTSMFLHECLDSILKQSYSNWELIIIDDHSTDNSYEIVNNYRQQDKRIKLFKNKGNGIIEALQLAFIKSTGTYITRMDSDDIMTPNKLEVLLHNLLSYGRKHVATGLVRYFSEDGINEGFKNYEEWLNSLTLKGTNYSEIYKECVIPSPCWMIHKDDLIACETFNPNDYPEDYDLTFRFYKYQMTVIPCDQVLHLWRDYSYRTSRTHEHYAQNYFLEIKLNYFLELDYNPSRPLVVWGAGRKGKRIAKLLIEKNVDFIWICNNSNKIGKDIYGKNLFSFKYLNELKNALSIITVSNKEAQQTIISYFKNSNKKTVNDYFFFC